MKEKPMFDTEPNASTFQLPPNLLKYAKAIQSSCAAERDATLIAASLMLDGSDEDEERFHALFLLLKNWGADSDKRSAVIAAAVLAPLLGAEGVIELANEMHNGYTKQYSKGACAIAAAFVLASYGNEEEEADSGDAASDDAEESVTEDPKTAS